jgi:hypothetical protein
MRRCRKFLCHDCRLLTEITLPFTDVFEYEGGLISQYKIYIDINPLYAD